MTYTRNYYHILGLKAPDWNFTKQTNAADLRRAYKVALLAAHPDKTAQKKGTWTVDDVKEAYTILADSQRRAEYDNYLLHNRDTLGSSQTIPAQVPSSDFILGLELLDLSDFDREGDEHGRMQWVRACRCGAERGFSILEDELEDAESKGEKEVLVGCEGCSLWVRVGFDVEEG
ncbi:hypothetical protein BDW02DRAFT_493230 [Decorospora gaudefroyi]|uniref:Diphthamide biosynthesis protein 4 n=1 Tax=Decorospora gaudefroyi TaxID=184978 RepID=A0A6A5KQ91_9PLEO|nr:hypothetical protein BDW02DRAFT_493230 [Decorospora gaudefroyi]